MNSPFQQIDAVAEGLGRFIIRWRWGIILAAVLAAVVIGSGARNLAFASNYRVFFSDQNPELQAFEDFQAGKFGR